MGFVKLKDGTIITSDDDKLAFFDGKVIKRMQEIHNETGIDILDARKQCENMLIANRKYKNKEDGYYILNLSGEGIMHARTLTLDIDDVASIAACSDGFYQLVDCFHKYPNPESLFDTMEITKLSDMRDELFDMQDSDPVCNNYPRLKLRDDTCAIWAQIIKK